MQMIKKKMKIYCIYYLVLSIHKFPCGGRQEYLYDNLIHVVEIYLLKLCQINNQRKNCQKNMKNPKKNMGEFSYLGCSQRVKVVYQKISKHGNGQKKCRR